MFEVKLNLGRGVKNTHFDNLNIFVDFLFGHKMLQKPLSIRKVSTFCYNHALTKDLEDVTEDYSAKIKLFGAF